MIDRLSNSSLTVRAFWRSSRSRRGVFLKPQMIKNNLSLRPVTFRHPFKSHRVSPKLVRGISHQTLRASAIREFLKDIRFIKFLHSHLTCNRRSPLRRSESVRAVDEPHAATFLQTIKNFFLPQVTSIRICNRQKTLQSNRRKRMRSQVVAEDTNGISILTLIFLHLTLIPNL